MTQAYRGGRYCDVHQAWGDHHTDRCPDTYGKKTPEEHERDMVQQQHSIMTGEAPKPYPGTPEERESKAVSARYPVACPTCEAAPKKPCRSKITKRITDTHRARIDAAYPNNP